MTSMTFDFDSVPRLLGQNSSKHDKVAATFGIEGPDVIPMWVADMDFRAAPCIVDALRREVERGFFGYFAGVEAVSQAASDWYARHHGWRPDPRHMRFPHGVIGGLGTSIAAFTEPGDGVAVMAPVYHAFYRQIEAQGRRVVEVPLAAPEGRHEIDWDAMQAAARVSRVLILCNPHNPGGRIWDAEEVARIARICAEHDLLLISDEIHMDLTHPGVAHVPAATAAPEHLDRLVVLTAASKGFNLAGGETGIAILPDAGRRAAFDRAFLDRESSPNRFAMKMIEAAFTEGDAWSAACRAYLAENFALFRDRISGLPGVRVMDMQATYLAWADFSGTGIGDDELLRRIVEDARIAPSPGPHFGSGGEGHMRFNLALPRARLREAIERLEQAFSDLQ